MKIESVTINSKARRIEILSSNRLLFLPFGKLRLIPSSIDPVKTLFIDKELGSQAVTYQLQSGKEDSVHLDAFLDFNRDRDYLRKQKLYSLSVSAEKAFLKSGLTKAQIGQILKTSPAQIDRLLDTAEYGKTIDRMIELLDVLGCQVNVEVVSTVA